MKSRINRSSSKAFLSVAAFALAACSTSSPPLSGQSETQGKLTLCRVLETSAGEIKEKVEFRAKFESDNQSYSHFLDEGCGHAGVLKVFGPSESSDGSWKRFNEHKRAICDARKATYLCAYTAIVDVVADVKFHDGERYAFV